MKLRHEYIHKKGIPWTHKWRESISAIYYRLMVRDYNFYLKMVLSYVVEIISKRLCHIFILSRTYLRKGKILKIQNSFERRVLKLQHKCRKKNIWKEDCFHKRKKMNCCKVLLSELKISDYVSVKSRHLHERVGQWWPLVSLWAIFMLKYNI